MSEFKISAPGRILLSGELAAMYGERVIMASLDRRTTLKFVELIDDPNIIKIEFPDVHLSLDVPLETVQSFFSNNDIEDIISNHIRLLRIVTYLITINGMWRTQEQRISLQTFFFLLFTIAYYEKLVIKSFHVHVSTQLSIGAGLGSSSSFAVCLAACFIHWASLQRGDHYAFNERELTTISNYAIYCERISQNYMFGADNYVCSYGKIIKSRYKNHTDSYDNDIIYVPTMKILLIDTNIRQNKSLRATEIAELRHYNPELVDFNLNIHNKVSKNICTTLVAINNMHQHSNFPILQVQEFVCLPLQIFNYMDQLMLDNLRLSHPKFDIIWSIAKDYGFGGKSTGLGSGFVYILLPPSIPEERITNLSKQLKAEGFNVMETSVCCSGVRIDD